MNLTDIFNSTSSGNSLLMDAVKNSDVELVKKLIEQGADINIPPQPSPSPFTAPIPAMPGWAPVTVPDAPAAAAPVAQKKQTVTKMATERQVVAPATARFKKKPQKRVTTL